MSASSRAGLRTGAGAEIVIGAAIIVIEEAEGLDGILVLDVGLRDDGDWELS